MAVPVRTQTGVALALAALAPAGFAHHSVGGEFNVHRKMTLTGVVSAIEWANPHIYVHFEAQGPGGSVAEWRLETVPVAMMRKAGLTKAMLMGNAETATVDIYPARDGTPRLGYMLKITYQDGHHYQFAPDD